MAGNGITRTLTLRVSVAGESTDADDAPMLEIVSGDARVPNPLGSAVLMSLMTDRAVEGSDLTTSDGDRGGWWGDSLAEVAGDKIGSRLWLLHRSALTDSTPRRAEEYAREALQWMIDDGVATSIDATATREATGIMLTVQIGRDNAAPGADLRYADVWEVD